MFKPEIFKAYDIRGIFQHDFDADFAYQLGLAYVDLRKNDDDYKDANRTEKMKIVVGSDMRLSSPEIKERLLEGLLDAGVDVLDINLSSTPTLYFAVANSGADGGIMISASHNPKEWNGFKVVRKKARPVSGDNGLATMRDKISSGTLLPAATRGSLQILENILEEQVKHDLKHVSLEKIKNLKVVADAANSMGSQYLEKIFNLIPATLLPLNFELDGSFPAHEADPLKDENNEQLKKMVIAEKADFGIATDGDGDRVFFVDNLGETINPAIIRGVLAKLFLQEKPGSKIGYDVRPGKITEDLIIENGGRPVITKVGHALIKEQMIKENIYFAGESSGHFYLQLDLGCFEMPMIIILKILQELSESGLSAAEYFKPYNKYFLSGEINSEVKDKQLVLKKLKEKYHDGQLQELDGLSVNYPDFWFNVRGSNTENKMRLNLEAKDEKVMTDKTAEVLSIIRE